MKNFRKVLALILVVATLFSFAAMTSAKEYKDADKVSYDEAVEVLTAIGILNGYDDGSFKPTDNIAREEMAKMVAVLSNAGDDVSDLYASACKFADTKDRWSASYVAFCNETGIVAGRNASTFDPRGKVTGLETAKMLLCLIGFDATAQGYVGSNWKTNVLRDAKAIGLLDGFAADYDISKAITREEAAQMMLNALEAPMVVGTISDNIVKVTNNVWVTLVEDLNGELKVGYTMSLKDAANWYGCYVLYGNVVVSPIAVWKNYTGLDCVDTRDCYGNPVTKWSFTNKYGKETWSATYEMPYTARYTVETDLATELNQLGNVESIVVYQDGAVTHRPASISSLKSVVKAASGKGVETKLFVDTSIRVDADDKSVYVNDVTVTIKNTYVGRVESVSKHDNSFTLVDNAYPNVDSFNNSDFGFKKDDIVLYWLCDGTCANCDGNLHDAKLANVVTGKVSETNSVNNEKGYAVVGGKSYEYAEKFNQAYGAGDMMDMDEVYASRNNGTEYDLYLDEFGYIMFWDVHAVETKVTYAYVHEDSLWRDTSIDTPNGRGHKYYADVLDFDGTAHDDMQFNATSYDAIADRIYDTNILDNYVGALISYTVDGEVSTATMSNWMNDRDLVLTKNGDLLQEDINNYVAYGHNETQYMLRTRDYSNGGKYVYTVMTHDELTSTLKGYTNAGYRDFDKSIVSIQYFTETFNNTPYLTYVFIDAMYGATAEYAYVTSGKIGEISADYFVNEIGAVDYYEAYINGEKSYLAVDQSWHFNVSADDANFLYKANLVVVGLTYNNVPVYAAVEAAPKTVNENHTIGYYKGRVSVSIDDKPGYNFYINDDTFVIVTVCNSENEVIETKRLQGVENVNEYLETYLGGVDSDGDPVLYYQPNNSWLVNANGVIAKADLESQKNTTLTELYIKIGHTTAANH